MTTQAVGYKAKAFEPRDLAFFFLIALVYKLLVFLLQSLGILIKGPSGSSVAGSILLVLVTLPLYLGPSGIAFVLTALTEGKPGVRALWGRFWNRNLGVEWLLVALLLLPVLRLVAGVLTQVPYHPSYPLLLEGGIPALVPGILCCAQKTGHVLGVPYATGGCSATCWA